MVNFFVFFYFTSVGYFIRFFSEVQSNKNVISELKVDTLQT
jgi:hypothetical protein